MKRGLFGALFALALLVSAQAMAMDLGEARSKGLVGEQLTGYVGVIKSEPGVTELVKDINDRRKAQYAKIAAQNGQPVDVVAKLAVQQIINGLPSGAYYQSASGNWVKK